jgi:ABC-type glycerol-3-phosphate transport system substrate-binding protein
LALPLIVDPIVFYYNKDILKNESIVYPPKNWDELFVLNPTLTIRDNGGVISRSMIALGQYDNVNNAKDILATLLIQNDNPIVEKGAFGYESVLDGNPLNLVVSPIQAVLTFFMEFSNSSDTAYSWNRSLPDSLDMFTAGKLAFYIGRASELFKIESINPNLSFDVTEIPQIKNYTTRRTFGKIYAIAVSKKSGNMASALGVATLLSSGDNAKSFSIAASLPPASKPLLANKPKDPYLFTFFDSALITKTWLDPDNIKSNSIFKELIESILSDSQSESGAIRKSRAEFNLLLQK